MKIAIVLMIMLLPLTCVWADGGKTPTPTVPKKIVVKETGVIRTTFVGTSTIVNATEDGVEVSVLSDEVEAEVTVSNEVGGVVDTDVATVNKDVKIKTFNYNGNTISLEVREVPAF